MINDPPPTCFPYACAHHTSRLADMPAFRRPPRTITVSRTIPRSPMCIVCTRALRSQISAVNSGRSSNSLWPAACRARRDRAISTQSRVMTSYLFARRNAPLPLPHCHLARDLHRPRYGWAQPEAGTESQCPAPLILGARQFRIGQRVRRALRCRTASRCVAVQKGAL